MKKQGYPTLSSERRLGGFRNSRWSMVVGRSQTRFWRQGQTAIDQRQTTVPQRSSRARTRSARRQRDDYRFHQIAEVGKSHAHQLTVRTGVEGDFLVLGQILGQSLVHENVHTVEIAEGGHGPGFRSRQNDREIRSRLPVPPSPPPDIFSAGTNPRGTKPAPPPWRDVHPP